MIVWRGLGILTVLLIGGGMGLMAALTGTSNTNEPLGAISVGTGLLLGGLATAALGAWLNILRPRQQTDKHLEALRAELHQRVQAGTFQVTPGAAAPSGPQEAAAQIEQVLEQQRPAVTKALRNRHTLFFIPMEWIGAAATIGGVVMVAIGASGNGFA